MNRRTFLRRGAAGAGGIAAAGVGADRAGLDLVDKADALIPAVVVGVAAAGGLATGFVLGEWDPLESESVPKGLTPDAFKQRAYQMANTRRSTNASAILDSENLVNASKNDAYAKGKVDAIEALNDQLTESEVVTAAHGAVDGKDATVTGNVLKDWNESVNEFEALYSTAVDHSDITAGNVFDMDPSNNGDFQGEIAGFGTTTVDLADGSTIDIRTIKFDWDAWSGTDTGTISISPVNTKFDADNGDGETYSYYPSVRVSTSDGEVNYLSGKQFGNVVDHISTAYTEVRNGLSTWVNTVYNDVQAGELKTEDLFTPAELAKLMPDGEGYPQAVADLQALGYAVDLEREMTIGLSKVDGTISGTMALTEKPDSKLKPGDTIDPSAESEDYYFTYDVSKGTGVWSEYQTGVDGGTVTFTAEPYQKTDYTIETVAGETVQVSSDELKKTSENGDWVVDLSGELENAITEIDSVTFTADVEGTKFETVQLDQEFTVKEITNEKTGDSVESASFTQTQTQTDDNYVTQEEWDELREQNQQLIEKYEKAKNDDGAPFGGLFGGGGGPGLLAMLAGLGGTTTVILAAGGAYIVASD